MVDFYSSFVSIVPTSQPDRSKDRVCDQTEYRKRSFLSQNVILIVKKKEDGLMVSLTSLKNHALFFLVEWKT